VGKKIFCPVRGVGTQPVSLKVLVVTPWFPNKPADRFGNFVFRSVEATVKAGVTVSVLVTRPWTPRIFGLLHPDWVRPPLREDLFDPALNIRVIHYLSIPRYIFSGVADHLYARGTAATMRNLIDEQGIELVHAHTEGAGYAAVAVARKCNVPAVVTLHGINTAPRLLNNAAKRQRLRNTLNGADRVVLVGEPLRAYFAPLAGRDDNFRVVPNGFFLPGGDWDRDSAPWGEVLRFVSLANLHEGKGIDLNLQALARLQQAGIRNWTYSIVGGGAEQARLEAMVDTFALRDKVRFHGRVSHDRALQLLADADVFVLPSYREAFGVAYLEAMGLGLLTVGVSGQGPEAFIAHGRTGLLVRPNDADSLYQAMTSVFENGQDVQRIAAAGKRFVHSEFTWARHAEKLIAVYREALDGR